MQRILLVTDDPQSLVACQRELVKAGYPVNVCGADAENLVRALMARPAEIFVLDGGHGRLTPKDVRALVSEQFPSHEARLIWLAAAEEVARLDPVSGLDDFVVLPATAEELLARVRLLLWKTHRVDGSDLMAAGDLVIDQANYSVSVGGQPLDLTYKEYELLRFLVSHRGRVFTREALLNQVWGYDYFGGTRTVDVHIRRIRAKLGPEREDMVETVRNVGYRFNAS
jgi:two-component system alkaline phosphatase synthesis response regulator PhoP